ncbi:MAG: 1-phosphofructokinase family hexose kinase [Rhodospirillales bacterium]|jgi:6-phosphofructokinase 2|nr:1-phosphofructokinase family hexose kinase [Rhodospirillales bacterium]
MKPVTTLTLNSSVDVQWEVDDMVPVRKLRASSPTQFPGGGGINVSRVIKTLGGQTVAIHTAGGYTGQFLRELVEAQGMLTRTIPIAGSTRISATVFERQTGQEFRITPAGPELTEKEWRTALDALFDYDTDYIVLTGSLPPGVPADYYGQAARLAKERGIRVILDTSGRALFESLKEGVYLIKPNLRELEHLAARKASTLKDQEEISRQIIDEGKAQVVALTLGEDGALLTWKEGTRRMSTPKVEVKSAVGAGDSFLAGMTLGLAQGRPLDEAFALGLAAGTATVLTAGTELCLREDVERLYEGIMGRPLKLDI